MVVRVHCPNPDCGKRYKVDGTLLGRATVCKHCGREFVIGASERETPSSGALSETGGAGSGMPLGEIPEKLGRFEIRCRLGVGAFGAVYRAHDPVLDREVALKVLRAAALERPEARARFLREPKAAAQLRHPHIVPVFDAGSDGEHCYIASAYIEGRTLEELIDEERPDFRRAAEIVRDLAEALDYAHRMGVVHRDVKPANIMIDAEGQAMLMDFGLARLETSEEKLTQDGSPMGTPAYMAPEQADSSFGEVGPASDQYSLGVVLYELLCGHPPFSGPPAVLIHNALREEPPPPRSRDPRIPRDLETICLKSMGKRPQDRYSDCGQLVEDLRRWLADEPIRARRMGPVERATRWARRNPLVAALVFVIVCVTVLGLTAVTWQWRRAEVNRALAQVNLAEVDRQREIAEKNLAEANRQREIAEKNLAEATRQREKADKNLTEANRQRRLAEDAQRAALANLKEARKQKEQVEEAREAERLQRVEAERASRAADAAKQLAEANLQEAEKQRQRAEQRQRALQHHLYAAELNLAMQALETGNFEYVHEILQKEIPKSPQDEDLRSFGWYYLASQSGFQGRPKDKVPAVVLKEQGPAVQRITVRPDATALSCVGQDGTIQVCNLDSRTWWTPQPPEDLWDKGAYLAGRRETHTGRLGWEGCLPLAWSADFLRRARAVSPESIPLKLEYDNRGRISFISRQVEVQRENPFTKGLERVRHYEPVRRVVVTGRGSGRTFEIENASEPMAFSPDGQAVAVTRWFRDSLRLPYPYDNLDLRVCRGAIEVWDVGRQSAIASYSIDGVHDVFALALSPSGKAVAVVEPQQVLRETNPNLPVRVSAAKVTLVSQNRQPIVAEIAPQSLVFSADGSKLLAHAPSDRLAVLFDASAGTKWRIVGLEEEAIALSADGQTLAMGYQPPGESGGGPRPRTKLDKIKAGLRGELDLQSHRTVQLWDVNSRSVRTVLGGHRYTVRAAAFSPDGKIVATGSEDATIKLWDASTGMQRLTLKAHTHAVLSLAFSADGSVLVSGSQDGTILLWRGEPLQDNTARAKQDQSGPAGGLPVTGRLPSAQDRPATVQRPALGWQSGGKTQVGAEVRVR
jgi:WD40 repeat protein/tRNA A-37 threonylcarbamoyl transferase component Bud32